MLVHSIREKHDAQTCNVLELDRYHFIAMPAAGADDDAADAVRVVPAATDVTRAAVGAMAVERRAPGVVGIGSLDRAGPANRPGPGLFFPGVADNTATTQVFRFFNAGRTAGTVTATIYDTAAGTSLGAWASGSIAAGAAIEVTAARIASEATPVLTAAQRAAALNLAVTASFRGTAQQISRTASAIINQSDCGAGGNTLGYVEGPAFSGVTGAVRFVNAGATAGTITLSLRDAATGTELGKYTSATVPAHGAVTVTTAAAAAAATPVVPASTTALTIVPTAATARIELEHLATVTASTTASNLSTACGI